MNGYVEKDGHKFLWIGKRSEVKPTYPGMLDHLVAGGLVCKGTSVNAYHFCLFTFLILCNTYLASSPFTLFYRV